MNFKKVFGVLVLVLFFAAACNNDDDNGPAQIPLRDQAEQYVIDNDSIVEFLQTHFYELDASGEIVFDTIAGDNAGRTPIFNEPSLMTKPIVTDEVTFNLYILRLRNPKNQAEPNENDIRVTDSTLVTYRGRLLDNTQFDRAINPIWFDLTGVIRGFSTSFSEFTAGNGVSETNADGTVTFEDFAQGAVFIPSGLGYFERAQPGIPFYSPLSFTFKIFKLEETDHDNDGIPSYMEDLDSNENPFDDDTDEDSAPNYVDADDDGDGTLTRDEITIDESGNLVMPFPDSDGDGIPDYLDNRNDS